MNHFFKPKVSTPVSSLEDELLTVPLPDKIKQLSFKEDLQETALRHILDDTSLEYSRLYAAAHAISLAQKHGLHSVWTPYGEEILLSELLQWLEGKMDIVTLLEEMTNDPKDWREVRQKFNKQQIPLDENDPNYYDKLKEYIERRTAQDNSIKKPIKEEYVWGTSEDEGECD